MNKTKGERSAAGHCTPFSKPERKEVGAHKHVWIQYDGCLGYESLVCRICGVDANEVDEV